MNLALSCDSILDLKKRIGAAIAGSNPCYAWFLGGASALTYAPLVEALRQGLRDHGYLEGKTVTMEFRWAEGQYDRLPVLAAELVRLEVDVIVTQGTPAAFAAQRATSAIPIVMVIVGSPVESGVVASLARPGGNVTGVSPVTPDLVAKRVELLREIRDSPGSGSSGTWPLGRLIGWRR